MNTSLNRIFIIISNIYLYDILAFVSTVGIDFKVKTVFRHDKRVKLQIWVGFMKRKNLEK